MQFEDPKSMLEGAAATPERGLDPYALLARGRRLRRARYAAVAAGLAVTLVGATASVGLISGRDRTPPVGAACDASERSVSIFVRPGASDADVERLRAALEADPGVERVEHVSSEETLEMLEELSFGSTIPGPDFVPSELRVLTTDEAAADRIVSMEDEAIGEVVRGFGAQNLDCLREQLCGRPIPLAATIFLRDGAPEEEVAELQARLRAIPGAEDVRYVSKRDAYREFERLYEDQPSLYETMSPSDLPASIRVTAANEEALQAIAESTSPAIDEVRWGGEFIKRLCRDVEVPEIPEPRVSATPEPTAEVTLMRQQCGSSLPGLGRARFPDGELGTWCLFALRIENRGEVPVALDPGRQRLSSKIATRLPSRVKAEVGAGLFGPIPPGTSKLGKVVYLLREKEAPVALEIEITGISRPIQFEVDGDCAAGVTRNQPDGCYLEHEFPPTFLIRGEDILQGTAEAELYHCGIMPIAFDKRSWIADPPPFDATNAPEDFVGRGWMLMRLGSLSATYLDESGVSFDVEAVEDWEQPPCA